jgi:hypothetical protein
MKADSLVAHSPTPAGLQVAPGEIIFLQDANAFVSNLRCVFNRDLRVYAASGITSVGLTSTPQKWGWSTILTIVALIAAVNDVILLATICILLAFWAWMSGRPKHYLSLHTSGVSYLPLWSRSREYVGSIVVAINNAIVARG